MVLKAGEFESLLAKPVSVDVKGLSHMESIEVICREHGLFPIFPSIQNTGMQIGEKKKI